MRNNMDMPTPDQLAQCRLAQHDMHELINRLLADGMDRESVLNAIVAALSDTIATLYGVPAVVPWLDRVVGSARAYIEGDTSQG